MSLNHTDCDFGAYTIEQLIMATIVKNDTTGVYYLQTVQTDVDCGDLVPAIECNDGSIDLATLLKKVIVIDECSGKPAWNLANCTCR